MKNFRSLLLAPAALLLFAGASAAPAADWTDLFVGYRYCYHVNDPAIDHDIIKNVVQFTTANRYSLGSNFLNVDVLMSNSYDPANGATSGGAQEIYVTYRHQLSMNKAFKAGIKSGLVRDVALTVGGDLNSKNTGFAPGKRMIVVGPTVNLNPKKGFADFGIWYYKEWTHNAFAANGQKDVEFDGTVMFNLTWGIPIALSKDVGSTFKGFAYATLPKGKDAVGVETETEVLSRITWQFDVGSLLGVKKGTIAMGPGYELWYHKFGNPSPIPVPGSTATRPNHTTSAPTFQAEIHF
jgi:hypothetical protein